METHKGFIKLFRSITDWEWYTEVNTCKLLFHCLVKANYSKKKWQGITINRGEFITSHGKLAGETGLSVSKVSTALDTLESTGDVTTTKTSKYTKVKVNSKFFGSLAKKNVDSTQDNIQNGEQLATKSHSGNNQMATTKNINNNEIMIRKKRFREKVISHSQFSKTILISFFNYWSEVDSDNNMRFETEKFWEVEKRLVKWLKNEKGKTNKNVIHKNR
jgi:DNA-binding transcriptional regulator YhcF (GntR family)